MIYENSTRYNMMMMMTKLKYNVKESVRNGTTCRVTVQ